MNKSFKQFLVESRIATPDSLRMQVMNTVASALFSINFTKNGKLSHEMKELGAIFKQKYGNFKPVKLKSGEYYEGVVNFDPKELPERYRKGLKLQKSYPLLLKVGEFGNDSNNHMAYYQPMGKGRSGQLVINLSMLPEIDSIGSVEGMETAIESLEGTVAHELQHATQDVVLRKKHPDQMRMGVEGESEDEYYNSEIEFQPQITTDAHDFKRIIKLFRKSGMELDGSKVDQLFRVFIGASNQMPEGMLKWKKNFHSPFFASLKKNDIQKWKKAVKDIHRLISGLN